VRARDKDAHAEGFPVVLTADRTLFFSPMSPSSLEREKGFTVDDMTEAHWELLIKCYEHDIKYTKEIINKVIVQGGARCEKGCKDLYRKGTFDG
jgi:hypothetical protein